MTATADLKLGLEKHIHKQLSEEFPSVEGYTRSTKRRPSDDARDLALGALDRYVLANIAPPLQNGLSLFNAALSAILMPTGCPGVDQVLSGGLRTGHLTEYYGPTNSGKTTLCLLTALTTVMSGYGVEWVDTCNGFGARRLHSLYAARQEASQPNAQERFMAASKLIKVRRAYQAQQLLDQLDALQQQLEEEVANNVPLPKLVVIDPFDSVVVSMLGRDARSQGHKMMAALARQCKVMADRFQLAVVVTQRSVSTSPTLPTLGGAWTSQPHTRLELSGTLADKPGSLREAHLAGSQIRSCGVSCLLDLSAPMSNIQL